MVFYDFFDEPQRPRPKFSEKDKTAQYALQKGKCNGCQIKFPIQNMTVDHIKPFSLGGTDKPSNLQLLCSSCNSTKGDGTQAYLKQRLIEEGILKAPAKPSPKTKTASATKKASSTAKAKTAAKATPKGSSAKTAAKSKPAKKAATKTPAKRTR